jgi:hypothetical protein
MKTNKIKRVLVEADILNKPEYLETFEYKGFLYGLQINFRGRAVTENMKFMGLSNPYITLTKYEIKTYAGDRYNFREPLETFDLDIPQNYAWSKIPNFVKEKLQNDFIKGKWTEWVSLSKSSKEQRFSFLNTLSAEDRQHLINYGKREKTNG